MVGHFQGRNKGESLGIEVSSDKRGSVSGKRYELTQSICCLPNAVDHVVSEQFRHHWDFESAQKQTHDPPLPSHV